MLGAPVPCMQAVHMSVGCVVVLCLVCAAVLHFTVQQVNPKDCEWAVLFLWSKFYSHWLRKPHSWSLKAIRVIQGTQMNRAATVRWLCELN